MKSCAVRAVVVVVVAPSGGALAPRGLPAYEPPERGPHGRHVFRPPGLLHGYVDRPGPVKPQGHQRRTPQQYVSRRVRLFPAERAQVARAVCLLAPFACAERGPGCRNRVATDAVKVLEDTFTVSSSTFTGRGIHYPFGQCHWPKPDVQR